MRGGRTEQPEDGELTRHAPERLLMLADGVFAISMTLLVIDVGIHEDVPVTAAGFAEALPGLLTRLGIFVAAFMITSRFWLVNHKQMARLHHVDDGVLGMTVLFLASITALPVATGVLFTFGAYRGAVTFAACVLTVAALLGARLWWYMSSPKHGLMDIDPDDRRHMMVRSVLVAVIYALAVPVAWLLPDGKAWGATFAWFLLALVDPLGDRLNRALRRRGRPAPA